MRIEVESANLDKLRSSSALKEAGLGVKTEYGLRPRMLVRFVPTEISVEEFAKALLDMNLQGFRDDEARIVRELPAGERSSRSIVIEVSGKARKALLASGRVFIPWNSCPIGDYVRVRQCYRCMEFDHLATNCERAPRCGQCAGEHEMRDCPNRNSNPCCANCREEKRDDKHSALDSRRCSVLKRRVDGLIGLIDYCDG